MHDTFKTSKIFTNMNIGNSVTLTTTAVFCASLCLGENKRGGREHTNTTETAGSKLMDKTLLGNVRKRSNN